MSTEQKGGGWSTGHLLIVVLLTVMAATVAIVAIDVLLVGFGIVLHAIFLHGLARMVSDRTPLPYRGALAVILVGTPLILTGVGFLIGPSVGEQIDGLIAELPETWDQVEASMREYDWLSWLLDQAPAAGELAGGASGGLLGRASGAVSLAAGWTVNLAVVLVAGIFLAISPRQYVDPALRLVPAESRPRAGRLMSALEQALRRWLVGRIASMIVVGVLTTVGLWLLGIPLALALGVIAGALAFIPNIGPLVAVVPAVLLAGVESAHLAIYVAALYAAIQLVESYLITPLIEKQAVSLPPAFVILSQLLIGVLFGLPGLIIATPLVVIAVVTVQVLYIEGVLGETVVPLGGTAPVTNRSR